MQRLQPIRNINKKDYIIDLQTGEMVLKQDYYNELKRRREFEKYCLFIFNDNEIRSIHKPPFPPALPNEIRPLNFEAPEYVEFYSDPIKPIEF